MHEAMDNLSLIKEARIYNGETTLSSKIDAGKLDSSVQLLSHIQLFVTPWTAVCQTSLSITNSWSLLKFMFIESVMTSNHLILCCPLLQLAQIHASESVVPSTISSSAGSIFSSLQLFPASESFLMKSALCIRWPKYWDFSFSINPSYEY